MIRISFFLLFLSLTSTPLTYAQRPGFEVPVFAVGRFFWISSDAPLSTYLNKVPGAPTSSRYLLDFISFVETSITDLLRSGKPPQKDDLLKACSFNKRNWFRSASNHFGIRGWPEPDMSCVTDFFGAKTFASSTANRFTVPALYEAAVERGQFIEDAGKPIADIALAQVVTDPNAKNWTEAHAVFKSKHSTLSQKCDVTGIGAVRVNGLWYLKTDITNELQSRFLANFRRQVIMEYTRVGEDNKFADPLLMRLQKRLPDGVDPEVTPPEVKEDTTTLLASFRGQADPSHFITISARNNPAVIDALGEGDFYVQQAQDALTPSGIAILILPLSLGLVPIALLANVGTLFMLFYTLMSDVLTVIPLGIKGVELINISNRKFQSTLLRISSSVNGTQSETSVAEFWAAQCTAHDNVRAAGIVFLSMAIVFMILGVSAEFIARRAVKKRKAQRLHVLGRKIKAAAETSKSQEGSGASGDKVVLESNNRSEEDIQANTEEDHVEQTNDASAIVATKAL